MRRYPPPGRIIYFYVVDESMRLVGVVPTRRLLLAPADKSIKDIMITNVVAIPNDATVLEACEFFTFIGFWLFRWSIARGGSLGVVDVDLYTEELAETGEASPVERDDVFQLIGVRLTRSQQARPLRAFRGRFPWLLCNIAGGTLAAILADIYHVQLNWQHAVLAIFIPVVLALAESVAIQSVTLTLDGIAASYRPGAICLKDPTRTDDRTPAWYRGGAPGGHAGRALARHSQSLPDCPGRDRHRRDRRGGVRPRGSLFSPSHEPRSAGGRRPIALASADVIVLLAYFNLALLLT